MSVENRESRFTVRCPSDVRARVDVAAVRAGLSSTAWVRQAILEKLERDEKGCLPATREELEAFVLRILEKRGV